MAYQVVFAPDRDVLVDRTARVQTAVVVVFVDRTARVQTAVFHGTTPMREPLTPRIKVGVFVPQGTAGGGGGGGSALNRGLN